MPEDYISVFLVLEIHLILPKDFAEKFAPSAGFRKVLVHMYDEDHNLQCLSFLQHNVFERTGHREKYNGS